MLDGSSKALQKQDASQKRQRRVRIVRLAFAELEAKYKNN